MLYFVAGDSDNEEEDEAEDSSHKKSHDLFSATPRVRAAFGMSSKYNKLIDAGEEGDSGDEEETKVSSKYNKLVEQNIKEDKQKKNTKSKSALLSQKKVQSEKKESADMNKENAVQKKNVAKNTYITPSGTVIKPLPRRRRESSSSHADEDSISECKGTEFHYRELDDEYGSRPTVVTSVAKPKDHDVISIISTSSQEYDPAPPKPLPVPPAVPATTDPDTDTNTLPDPIIGHEHGVRPLLDDDELENAYDNQGKSDMRYPSGDSETPVDMDMDVTSPVPKPHTTDIFGAAPFRRKVSKKRRPGSGVFTGSKVPSAREEDSYDGTAGLVCGTGTHCVPVPHTKPTVPVPHTKPAVPAKPKLLSSTVATTKPAVPVKPSRLMSKSDYKAGDEPGKQIYSSRSSRRHRHVSGEEMHVGLIRRSDSDDDEISVDIFDNAPFMKRSSSSADALTSTVSPVCDPARRTDMGVQRTGFTNSFSADSLDMRTDSVSDSFGAIPFSNVQISSLHKQVSRPLPTRQTADQTSIPLSKLTMMKPVVEPVIKGSGTATSPRTTQEEVRHTGTTSAGHREPASMVPNYQKFRDESDSDESDFRVSESSKYSKVKPVRSPRQLDRDIENSAFSNMSFNDDFEEEEERELREQYERTMEPVKYAAEQRLTVPKGQHAGFIKDPSPVNHESAKLNNAGGYDTFTWPRKRHKTPQKPQATAEPFTVKKRVDVFK